MRRKKKFFKTETFRDENNILPFFYFLGRLMKEMDFCVAENITIGCRTWWFLLFKGFKGKNDSRSNRKFLKQP
jgi:hypothetical protein